jgi:group I intron endonuclease
MRFNVKGQNRTKTGVYQIKNLVTGHVYIGSTKNSFIRRFQQHLSDYNRGRRKTRKLFEAFDQYGLESFEFSVVCICIGRYCIEAEQFYIDKGAEYNIMPYAGNFADFYDRKEVA